MLYQQKRKYSRAVSVGAYIALLSYLIAGTFDHPLEGISSMAIIGIKCCPLLGFASAMYKQHLRQMAWMCFVLLIYFTIAVMYVPITGPLGVFIITLLYTSAMLHIRWHNRVGEEVASY